MILVTGGAGYIGSHVCVELLNSGYEVIVIDNFINSSKSIINRIMELTNKSIIVYETDLHDRIGLRKVFANHDIDVVIHLAGYKSVGDSVKQPLDYYSNNIVGTIVLCEVMQEYGVEKMVFSSSATVYGLPKQVPISEDFPMSAINPYGRTKLMVETILQDVCHSNSSWGVSILRYFNPVGAHESGMIGEVPNGIPNNLMPYLTQVAIGIRKQLKIYGNNYNTPDGTAIRDYIHVVDLAKGHIHALNGLKNRTGITVYNLGTGRGCSVLELVNRFEKVTNQKIPYIFTDRRPGDVEQCYANPSRANKELGWVAVKSIEDMCRDSWSWQLHMNQRLSYEYR